MPPAFAWPPGPLALARWGPPTVHDGRVARRRCRLVEPIRTGQSACSLHVRATEPSSRPARPPWPRRPTTRNAAPLATSMSIRAGWPSTALCDRDNWIRAQYVGDSSPRGQSAHRPPPAGREAPSAGIRSSTARRPSRAGPAGTTRPARPRVPRRDPVPGRPPGAVPPARPPSRPHPRRFASPRQPCRPGSPGPGADGRSGPVRPPPVTGLVGCGVRTASRSKGPTPAVHRTANDRTAGDAQGP